VRLRTESTTKDVTTSGSHSSRSTTNSNSSILTTPLVQRLDINTGTSLESVSSVGLAVVGLATLGNELRLGLSRVEEMSPDRKGTGSSGSAAVVMTSL
jgi:hypothetical protein